MRSTLLLASIAVAALCAGCADTDWGNHGRSNAMGANASSSTTCQDGTVLPPNSRCAIHGGVSGRSSTSPSQGAGGGSR